MSEPFQGLDTDAMTVLRRALDAAGEIVAQVRLQQSIGLVDTPWHGADAAAYRDQWFGSFAPSLIRIGTALADAANTVAEQTADQERVSSGGGSAGGGAGVGGGLGAAAGAGAVAATAGTGTGTGTTTPQTGDVSVRTPFYSQFASGHGYRPGNTSCFQAAKAMARDAGATVLGPADRIQVATGEAADGSVTVDATRATQGRDYLDSELAAGRPVVVGVSHKSGYRGNVDGLTDHFVTVTGRGSDASGTYYTFNDPATRHSSLGSDTRLENRFRVGADGGLYRDIPTESAGLVKKDTWVSMVRRNAESGR